jgi:hypothetical protein
MNLIARITRTFLVSTFCLVNMQILAQPTSGEPFGAICTDAKFDWVKKGTVRVSLVGDIRSEIAYYIYTSGGIRVALNGSLTGLAGVVKHEDLSIEQEQSVIGKQLPRVLVATMGGPSDIVIDSIYVSRYRLAAGYINTKDGRMSESEINRRMILMERYEKTMLAKFIDGRWVLDFAVHTGDEAVEVWEASGTVTPFSIDSFKRVLMEPSGSIQVLPQTY